MSSVYLLGAGASCEYRAKLPGMLFSQKFRDGFFLDCNFFEFVDVMWEEWFEDGAKPPDHYDGTKWNWPALEGVLKQTCGNNYRTSGLERCYSAISDLVLQHEALFLRCIELVLFHQLRGVLPANLPVHLEFVRKAIKPGDVLLTFNYDPLIEQALLLGASDGDSPIRWHERDGYGVEVVPLDSNPPPRPDEQSNVHVLKLHGSVDWLCRADEQPTPPLRALRITSSSMRGQGMIARASDGVPLRPVIVPPLPNKSYEAMVLQEVWELADRALAKASSLTVIGYSLPPTDDRPRQLLARAAGRIGHEAKVTFVTRSDGEAAARFKCIFPAARVVDGGFAAYVLQLPGPRRQ